MGKPDDPVNGFCDYEAVPVEHAASGPLLGLTLAVKDIYAVKGYPNGWGSPTRLAETAPDAENAPVIQMLLDAGAEFVGKTQCDEMCYSLNGINAHYGAPLNMAAPERITGGSSSGSAALVAAGVVDIATGSDTGGSIRAPASYCGLIGLRTSHGRISLEGTMPLAPSFDVFGWFTRGIEDYQKVAKVLLGEDDSACRLQRPVTIAALDNGLLGNGEREAFGEAFDKVAAVLGMPEKIEGFSRPMSEWYWTMRYLQAREAWLAHKDWITSSKPDLGPGVKDRFEFGVDVSEDKVRELTLKRNAMREELAGILGDDGVLIMPTVPSAAPLKDASHDSLQDFREKALELLCVSGLTGFPQITLPLAKVCGAPLGISLMGPNGSDRRLVELAARIMA